MNEMPLYRMLVTLWAGVFLIAALFMQLSGFLAGFSAGLGGALAAFAQSWYLWRIAWFYKGNVSKGNESVADPDRFDSKNVLRLYYRAEAAKIAWLVITVVMVLLLDQGRLGRFDLDLNLLAFFAGLVLVQIFCVLISTIEIARVIRKASASTDAKTSRKIR